MGDWLGEDPGAAYARAKDKYGSESKGVSDIRKRAMSMMSGAGNAQFASPVQGMNSQDAMGSDALDRMATAGAKSASFNAGLAADQGAEDWNLRKQALGDAMGQAEWDRVNEQRRARSNAIKSALGTALSVGAGMIPGVGPLSAAAGLGLNLTGQLLGGKANVPTGGLLGGNAVSQLETDPYSPQYRKATGG